MQGANYSQLRRQRQYQGLLTPNPPYAKAEAAGKEAARSCASLALYPPLERLDGIAIGGRTVAECKTLKRRYLTGWGIGMADNWENQGRQDGIQGTARFEDPARQIGLTGSHPCFGAWHEAYERGRHAGEARRSASVPSGRTERRGPYRGGFTTPTNRGPVGIAGGPMDVPQLLRRSNAALAAVRQAVADTQRALARAQR